MGMFIFGMEIALFVIVAMEELKEKNRQTRSKAIPANSPKEIKCPASSVPMHRKKFFLEFSLCLFYRLAHLLLLKHNLPPGV
jgi:hypothetical protein